MMNKKCFYTFSIWLLMPALSYALDCKPLEPTKPVLLENEIEGKVEGSLDVFLKKLGSVEFEGRYKSLEEDLLSKYPKADRLYLWGRLIYLLCTQLDASEQDEDKKFEKLLLLSDKMEKGPPTHPTKTQDDKPTSKQVSTAGNLAREWFNALLQEDIYTLIKLTDSPFASDKETFTEKELIVMYQDIFEERKKALKENVRPGARPLQEVMRIKSIRTIAQLKSDLTEVKSRGGAWPSIEKVLQSLTLSDKDLVIESILRVAGSEGEEPLFLFIRNVDDQLKLAGIAG
jgi:hypothetical protein